MSFVPLSDSGSMRGRVPTLRDMEMLLALIMPSGDADEVGDLGLARQHSRVAAEC